MTRPRSSQPAGSPLAKHSEHTVKCVLPVSKVTVQGKGARGGGKAGAAGLVTEAGVPIRSRLGPGHGLPCCNSAGEMLGMASGWPVPERTPKLPGMPSLGKASLSSAQPQNDAAAHSRPT